MADEGVAEHYQVLEELGRKFEALAPKNKNQLTISFQGEALVLSTKASKRQLAKLSLSNM